MHLVVKHCSGEYGLPLFVQYCAEGKARWSAKLTRAAISHAQRERAWLLLPLMGNTRSEMGASHLPSWKQQKDCELNKGRQSQHHRM